MPKIITTPMFIEKANQVHNNIYDYSKVEYINNKTKVCIICHKKDENGIEHGEFWQDPNHHIQSHCGCPKCALEASSLNQRKNIEQFIKEANQIHNNKYDYSKVQYKNNYTKVTIICPKHGEFKQSPQNHLRGQQCPECAKEKRKTIRSKGELFIYEWLTNNKIEFEQEKYLRIENLNVYVDFMIGDIIIEYNGKQHYEYTPFFHKSKLDFLKQQYRDNKLREYCKLNNIKLVEIKYDQNLEEEVQKLKPLLTERFNQLKKK